MNKTMQTFRTKTHELSFREMLNEVKEISLVYFPDSDTGYTMIYYDGVRQEYQPGDWQLLTDDCTKVTKEQAKIVCEEYKGLYRMYEHSEDYFWIKGALNSFASIVESLELLLRNKYSHLGSEKPNREVEVTYDGGYSWDNSVEWQETRTCMLAGTSGGSGYFGEGWGTSHDSKTDFGLICDPPDLWRYVDEVELWQSEEEKVKRYAVLYRPV